MMLTKNKATSLPKIVPPDGFCRGCVLGNHHYKEPFDSRKAWQAHDWMELVYIDFCYMKKPSLVGEKVYFNLH